MVPFLIAIVALLIVGILVLVQYLTSCECRPGPTGASGPSGSPGVQGPCGFPGTSGLDSGSSGPSGLPGLDGPNGASGLNVTGPSGASGPCGSSGSSGALGLIDSTAPLFINASTANALSVPNSSVTVGGTTTVTMNGTLSKYLGLLGASIGSVETTLTTNQLLNFSVLNTPVVLVPAQGANTLIRLIWWNVVYIPGTIGFTTTTPSVQLYFAGSPDVTNGTNVLWGTLSANGAGASIGVRGTVPHYWVPSAGLAANSLTVAVGTPYPNGANNSQKNYINTPLLVGQSSGTLIKPIIATDWTGGNGSMFVAAQYILYSGLL